MENSIESIIHEMAFRVRLYKLIQSAGNKEGALTERDMTMLELINMKNEMSISKIAALYPTVSSSTISNTITKLWREDKLVNKKINPDNQRITNVSLTQKGKEAIQAIKTNNSRIYATIVKALDLDLEEEEVFNRVLKKGINFFDDLINSKIQ